MSLLVSPRDLACRTIVKKSLETVLSLHFTRKHAAFALRTSKRRGKKNNQNKTRGEPRKQASTGTGITPRPKANSNPNGQGRKASKINPGWYLRKFSHRVIPPFLILFPILSRLMPQFENAPFHTACERALERRIRGLTNRSNSMAALQNIPEAATRRNVHAAGGSSSRPRDVR